MKFDINNCYSSLLITGSLILKIIIYVRKGERHEIFRLKYKIVCLICSVMTYDLGGNGKSVTALKSLFKIDDSCFE